MNEMIKNKKQSEILAEEICKLHYGDFVTHGQIAEIIGISYPSPKYSSTISKAKKLLMKSGVMIENVIGDGYRVLEPGNFVNQSMKHYRRGANELQKGFDTLANAPVNDMDFEQRETHKRVYDKAVTLNAFMKGASVELKTLADPSKNRMTFADVHVN